MHIIQKFGLYISASECDKISFHEWISDLSVLPWYHVLLALITAKRIRHLLYRNISKPWATALIVSPTVDIVFINNCHHQLDHFQEQEKKDGNCVLTVNFISTTEQITRITCCYSVSITLISTNRYDCLSWSFSRI